MKNALVGLKISEYTLLFDEKSLRTVVLKLRQRRLPDGRIVDLWAISQSGDCLGKTPDQHGYFTFDFEPLPSSRDELHYQEYRFDSAEEAYQFWLDNRPKILATQDEWLEFIRVIRGV